MKMMGKLGWYGQCGCCCGRDTNKQIKRREEIQWRKEYDDELPDDWQSSTETRIIPSKEEDERNREK